MDLRVSRTGDGRIVLRAATPAVTVGAGELLDLLLEASPEFGTEMGVVVRRAMLAALERKDDHDDG